MPEYNRCTRRVCDVSCRANYFEGKAYSGSLIQTPPGHPVL